MVSDPTQCPERRAAMAQPRPIPASGPLIKDLVIKDIRARAKEGKKKYGVYLQPSNGRDALYDAYQEALDLTQYLRQEIYERDNQ